MHENMTENYLIDTDVLIDFLRGNPKAVQLLNSLRNRAAISCITVSELYAGVREGREREVLTRFIHSFDVLALDEKTAVQAGLFKRDYSGKAGTGLADAMIAATAHLNHRTLMTLNQRHFPMLKNVFVPYQKNN
jgi:predicted nucleic acid-binding protein